MHLIHILSPCSCTCTAVVATASSDHSCAWPIQVLFPVDCIYIFLFCILRFMPHSYFCRIINWLSTLCYLMSRRADTICAFKVRPFISVELRLEYKIRIVVISCKLSITSRIMELEEWTIAQALLCWSWHSECRPCDLLSTRIHNPSMNTLQIDKHQSNAHA
jgi:hypothetical protein